MLFSFTKTTSSLTSKTATLQKLDIFFRNIPRDLETLASLGGAYFIKQQSKKVKTLIKAGFEIYIHELPYFWVMSDSTINVLILSKNSSKNTITSQKNIATPRFQQKIETELIVDTISGIESDIENEILQKNTQAKVKSQHILTSKI